MTRMPIALCLVAVLALPALAAGAAGPAAPPPSPAIATPDGQPVAVVGRFRLHSGFWVALHQTLLATAQGRGLEGMEAEPAERAVWEQAVAAYRERFGERSPVLDRELIAVNDALSGRGADAAPPPLPDGLAEVLQAAAPVYRARRWPADDRASRFWIAVAAALLAEAGEELVAAHERVYEAPYPRAVTVDVAPFGGRYGAYTTVGASVHVTMTSRDPGYQGFAALEMLLHETSHAVVGHRDGEIGPELAAHGRALGVEVPADLWHAILFHTSGELARRALAARGVDYTPVSDELFERVYTGWREPVVAWWQRHLDGTLPRDAALRGLVEATGRAAPR